MKKTIAMILAVVMCVCLFAGCGAKEAPAAPAAAPKADTPAAAPAAAAAEPVVIKVGYGLAEDTTLGIAMQAFADEVAAATEGRVTFEIYSNGQLGTLVEMIEAVELGQLDATMNDASLMVEYAPELNLLALPMLFSSFESWEKLTTGEVGQKLADVVAEKTNMYVMGWIFNGFREILCKPEINSMDDCTGVVIRSPEADIYVQTLTRLNFTPTPLAFSELYTALQTGVVSACETSYEQFILNSFYEEATHMVESNHMAANMTMLFNQKVWAKISAEDQATMTEIYNKVFGEASRTTNELAEGFKQELLDKGCTCYNYSADELNVITERFTDYWAENANANGYADILEMAIAAR